jgi:hypothetical protein
MKTHILYTLLATLFLLADVRRSFVDPAPVDEERGWYSWQSKYYLSYLTSVRCHALTLKSNNCLTHSHMELECSLPCSQKPSTGPYPEPDQSNRLLRKLARSNSCQSLLFNEYSRTSLKLRLTYILWSLLSISN